MALIDSLNWRYATKRMTGETVSTEKLHAILDATQLSASSYGLQPYTILVVSDPEVKLQLQAAAYGQPQLIESSHILIFCALENITETTVSDFINQIAAKRGVAAESLKGYQDMIQGTINGLSQEQQQIWGTKQAYIALGTALVAAAEQEIDACPMEGFAADKFSEILGLKEKGLKAVVILPLGYRSAEDQSSGAVKVRKEKAELFQFID